MSENRLIDYFKKNKKIAMGFSGGVDSSLLLYYANKYCDIVAAYFVKSQFQPQFELDDAKKLAEKLGVEIIIINLNVLESKKVIQNDKERCYYCKKEIFGTILKRARKDGFTLLIDGSNASDDFDDRPGMRALEEMKVESPLRICDLDKKTVRELSKKLGLFTWNKPSYACLATRIETGTIIKEENLRKIELLEAKLKKIGLREFRLRILKKACKIEVVEDEFSCIMENREEIYKMLKESFDDVLLDLKARTTD